MFQREERDSSELEATSCGRSQLIPHAQSEHKPDSKPDPDPDRKTSQDDFQWEDKSLQKLEEWIQKENEMGIRARQESQEKLHDYEQKAIMYEMCTLQHPATCP